MVNSSWVRQANSCDPPRPTAQPVQQRQERQDRHHLFADQLDPGQCKEDQAVATCHLADARDRLIGRGIDHSDGDLADHQRDHQIQDREADHPQDIDAPEPPEQRRPVPSRHEGQHRQRDRPVKEREQEFRGTPLISFGSSVSTKNPSATPASTASQPPVEMLTGRP